MPQQSGDASQEDDSVPELEPETGDEPEPEPAPQPEPRPELETEPESEPEAETEKTGPQDADDALSKTEPEKNQDQ